MACILDEFGDDHFLQVVRLLRDLLELVEPCLTCVHRRGEAAVELKIGGGHVLEPQEGVGGLAEVIDRDSARPPTVVAMTGIFIAWASSSTVPKVSSWLGRRNISAFLIFWITSS